MAQGQTKGKYWLGNNPNAQITNDEITELGSISETDLGVVSDLTCTADEINNTCDASASGNNKFNIPVTLVAGGAGDDVTIQSLSSGKIYHFGTGTGALGNADDDDAFTFKLPTPAAAGERITVMPVNASVYAKLLGFVCNAPATETITYYAYGVADGTMIESASTATGTAGSENVFVKLSNSHFVLGITFEFTSMSTTNWRLDIHDPGNIIASGDIAVAAGNAGGYVS